MTAPRFYAACLASYNNGVLHGTWIDASTDTDEMAAAIAEMLRASKFPNVTVEHPETGEMVPSAEEYAIHDYDGLPSSFGEYPGLDKIAEYVELLEAAEDRGMPAEMVAKVVDNFGGDIGEAKEAIEDKFCGVHDSLEAYAEDYIESTGMLDGVNDTIARYFDFQAFARDLELGGDIWTIRHEGDLYVFSA
jgi:antirestriction protein